MQDWSASEDANFSVGEFRLAPDNEGGIYLDEGYDPLGRRRPALAPGETRPRESAFAPPNLGTHWGRVQAAHWNNGANAPLRESARAPSQGAAFTRPHWEHYNQSGWPVSYAREGFAAAPSYARGAREGFAAAPSSAAPSSAEPAFKRAGPGPQAWAHRAIGPGPQGRAAVGIHQSDTANLPSVYDVSYDSRPAGYSPEGTGGWARLLPSSMLNEGQNVPPCAGQFKPADFPRGDAQDMTAARGPRPVVLQTGVAEGFAGANANANSFANSNLFANAAMVANLQLLFLFVIAIVLGLILQSIERSRQAPVAYRARPGQRWDVED